MIRLTRVRDSGGNDTEPVLVNPGMIVRVMRCDWGGRAIIMFPSGAEIEVWETMEEIEALYSADAQRRKGER